MKLYLVKISKVVFLVYILLFATSDTKAQYGKWIRDTTFHDMEFKKIRFAKEREFLHAQGILKSKTIVDGFPCHKKITLTKNGHAKFFILAEDYEILGNKLKKETQIIIRRNGDILIHCLYNPQIQGYLIRKENYLRPFFMGSTNFQLYPDGKLKFFNPVHDVLIQGVVCKSSSVWGGVYLYQNGNLKRCYSATEQTIQDVQVGKKYTLEFSEDGQLTYVKKEKFFE